MELKLIQKQDTTENRRPKTMKFSTINDNVTSVTDNITIGQSPTKWFALRFAEIKSYSPTLA